MAAALRCKAHPLAVAVPSFLTWKVLGFRSICSGRLGFVPQSPAPESESPVSPGRKILEAFKEEFEIGSCLITLETGKIARFANGSVVLGMEETRVLSTVASAKADGLRDFLPLTVDYQEKQYAQGVIPTTFMRREGAPKERELLCGRLIDRPIRPLFPSGFYHEVQVMASVLSSDGKQDPDVMAANATSAALMLSDIPWGGPIGVIRLGRINGHFVFNPSMDELSTSDLNLVYACTRDKTLMIDVQAREISERDLEAGLRLAHPEAVKYIEPQIRLAERAGKHKKEYRLSLMTERSMEKITSLTQLPIEAVFTDPSYGKFERGEALDKIMQDVKVVLEEECDEESLKCLPKAVDTVRKKVVRRRIIEKGLRVDGRQLDEVRPLHCEAGTLPILHGSSLFSRGDTQVLCTVTLGAPGDAQRLDSLVGPPTKRFMLHYSFPPFSINEVGKRGGLNRREVGHGTLAEKALLAVLPPEDCFPYTVRINSEVMASDGSTSMATVCGGSMALMDAGIPLREHVAGVSVGLVSDVNPSTGKIQDYRILTDILGLEDHLGDMDFKIAGTRKGVTAIQLDIKPAGIPLEIICESLNHARNGRLQILNRMEQEINAPRTQDDRNAPQLATVKLTNDALRRLLGPQGSQKKKIEQETGARLAVSDGTLTIVAKNQLIMEKTQEKEAINIPHNPISDRTKHIEVDMNFIKEKLSAGLICMRIVTTKDQHGVLLAKGVVYFIIGREIEVGGIYKGVVASIKEYGAFVEFNGGQHGLLHISELSNEQVSKVSDIVSIGQELLLKCIGQDVRGNIKLSLKATLPEHGSEAKEMIIEDPISTKPAVSVWAPVGDVPNCRESDEPKISKDELDGVDSATYSIPSIVIRSAAECDAQDILAGTNPSEKTEKSVKSSPRPYKSRSSLQNAKSPPSTADLSSSEKVSPPPLPKPRVSRKTKPKAPSGSKQESDDGTTVISVQKDVADKPKPSGGKSVKLGDIVVAQVYQIRAHGLVLDLGGGVRGMYKFPLTALYAGRRDFEVGKMVRVKCCSFSGKGIPVMSLLDDE